jgi:predicted 2-oxoglutarate/Fe(II)-dependent dioxygenase YbiX
MKDNTGMFDPYFVRPEFKPRRLEPCFCESGLKFRHCCGKFADGRMPPHGVGILKELLSKDQCKEIVEYCTKRPYEALGVYQFEEGQDTRIELSGSNKRITDRVEPGEKVPFINKVIYSALKNEIAEVCNREFSWLEEPQLLRYSPGGHFAKHADSELRIPGRKEFMKNVDRDISILLYLNDDFDGGHLKFHHFNYTYKPSAGDLLFFPSDHRYEHEATTLETGLRFVVVSWAAFEGERRVSEERMPGLIQIKSEKRDSAIE